MNAPPRQPAPLAPQAPHAWLWWPVLGWAMCVLWLAMAQAAHATGTDPAPEPPLQTLAESWAHKLLETRNTPGQDTPLRPEIVFGQLDSRLQLAPCGRVEPYLPDGAKLWGRSRIGLRCVEGPSLWNVFIPVTVKVWGPAWLVTRTLAPGEVMGPGDAQLGEADWAENPAPVLVQQGDWLGVATSRSLAPGQPLRHNMVRPVRVFDSGTEVKVVVTQARFHLASSGRAMSHGFVGQPVRVKLGSGKVVSGRVKRDASVAVDM